MMCQCSSKHVPKPVVLFQIDIKGEKVHLCPTAYVNLDQYLTRWRAGDTLPPGHFRKHYSAYIQELAGKIYDELVR